MTQTEEGTFTLPHGAISIKIEINPLTGKWVHTVLCDDPFTPEEFPLLRMSGEVTEGVQEVRSSLDKCRFFVDFWDTELCPDDVLERTYDLLWEFQRLLSESAPPVIFSHRERHVTA
jgi:hypothetical protein